MKRLSAWLPIVFLLLFATQSAYASNILDQTTDVFKTAAAQFGDRIKVYGFQLLVMTASIQLSITTLKKLISGGSLEDVITNLLWSNVMPYCFFLFLIYSSSTVLPSIINSFDFLGQKGSGLDQLTPSIVMTQGIQIQDVMVQKFNETAGTGLLDAIQNFFPAMVLTGCCFIVLLSFMVLAAQMALALISAYFWLAVTPFMIGFAGVSFTRDIAMGALKGGIAIGMKILCVYMIAGVATHLAPIMGNGMASVTLTDWSPMFWVTGVCFILAYLSFQLPKLASDLMNGTASISAGDAGSNMAAAAAMTAGAGVAAAGAVGGASSALLSAASSGIGGSAGSLSSAAASGLEAGSSAGGAAASVAPPAGGSGSPAGGGAGAAVTPPAPSSTVSGSGGETSGAVPPPPPAGATEGGTVGGSEAPPVGSSGSGAVSPPAPLGDASGASLSGSDGQGQDNKGPGVLDRAASAYSNVLEHQQAVPQDSHTVGLSASLSHRTD